jgi:predicted aspartyl protease
VPPRALDHLCEFAVPRFITSDFVSLAYTIGLLVVTAGIVFALYRVVMQAISTVMLWVLVGLTLIVCYSYRSELHEASKRFLAESTPAHSTPHGATVTASVPTREILQSMRRSMGRP